MRKILVESPEKNLVEHQIIKNDRKFNSIICRFFDIPVKMHSVCYMAHTEKNEKMMPLNFLIIFII